MSFDTSARRQAKVAFDALADRLVKDLSTVAQDEAEAAAARAREEAERAAEKTIAAARAEGEAKLAAAQATNAGLMQSVESAREEVRALEKRLEQGQQERKQLVQARDEAGKKLDIETRRANEVASHLDAQTRRASELASQLDDETKRVSELATQVDGETQRAQKLAAQLEAETRRTTELTSRLDVETRRASELKTQFEGETRRAGELGSQLDGERRRTADLSAQLEGETRRGKEVGEQLASEINRSVELTAATEEIRQRLDTLVERVGTAISTIDRATSPSEILETLLEPISRDFAVSAVFLVSPSSFNGWRDVGLAPATDVAKLIIPRDGDSLLTRAAAERKRLFAASTAKKPLVGLLGNAVARAAALPVLAGEQVVAVVYAEDSQPSSAPAPAAGMRITEMLIDHANLRLTVKRSPTTTSGTAAKYSTPRQAPRVKSRDGVGITVDGAESALVDVSTSGAQILSPVAMKPNRTLRMLLRAGEQAITCKARVIWARFEQPRGAAAARYRVGVKFTEVEPDAIDDFIQQGLVLAAQ